MDKEAKKCTSCGKEVLSGFVEFKCPNCNKDKMVRCSSCRTLGTPYTCHECGFTGP
ncbi:MAG: zinc finger domain-containing protein [Candidatus Altiarchaeota archaeon]